MTKKRTQPYQMNVVGAFISPKTEVEVTEGQGSLSISTSIIDKPPSQPRRYFDPEKMSQLAASIKKKGILEPILVRPKGGRYELIAGERRLRAALEVGLKEVPCVVRSFSDEEAAEIALLENLQRDDLNPIEETEGILELLSKKLNQDRDEVVSLFNKAARSAGSDDIPKWDVVEELFEVVGRFTPQSFRTNRLPLLKLPQDVLEATRRGEIEYSKARLIGRISDDKERSKLLGDAIRDNLSREEIQESIEQIKKTQTKSREPKTLKRLGAVYQKAKKSDALKDKQKRDRIEKLLDQIEKIIDV